MTGQDRLIVIRDPIHKDIPIGPVQAAIIDTAVFQRLRYIRQNGLLHLVFPGAVHTRFAHSIGTMHLAQRVFRILFPEYVVAVEGCGSNPVQYVGTVFETAALLHDIGHCAFSHALEPAETGGKPFFAPMADLVAKWDEQSLTTWWNGLDSELQSKLAGTKTEHEQIGLLMMAVLFGGKYPHVATTIRSVLGVEATDFGDDVRAVANGQLTASRYFLECAAEVGCRIAGATSLSDEVRAEGILSTLHTLISGTLDVDRMDYLLRDSLHAGVPYGIYDLDVLVSSVALHVSEEPGPPQIYLALRSRATGALDDMLWSRYQLFSQVLNHKVNVMLNALMAKAIMEEVVEDAMDTGIAPPNTFENFILLTDDKVMSSVVKAGLTERGSKRAYGRALVHRVLPMHLGSIVLSGDDSDTGRQDDNRRVAEERDRLVARWSVQPSAVREWKTGSWLVKGGGLPHVLRKEKAAAKLELIAPASPGAYQIVQWTETGKLPAKVELMHFFTARPV